MRAHLRWACGGPPGPSGADEVAAQEVLVWPKGPGNGTDDGALFVRSWGRKGWGGGAGSAPPWRSGQQGGAVLGPAVVVRAPPQPAGAQSVAPCPGDGGVLAAATAAAGSTTVPMWRPRRRALHRCARGGAGLRPQTRTS